MKLLTWLITASVLVFVPSVVHAEIVERIAAVINNDVITLSELDDVINSVQGPTLAAISDLKAREAKRQEFRKQLLEQMIDQRLLTQQYDKHQITATEQDVESMIDSICRQNNITRDVLQKELEKQGIALSDYKDQMRQHVLQGKFIEQQIRPRVTISEEDVKSLYTRKLGELTEGNVAELTGVLVVVARGGGPEAVQSARNQAEGAREQLLKGVSPDEIARQSSDGSVKSLGDMGTFRKGELMETLDQVVFSLKAGEVSAPIEAPQGLYILKVLSLGRQTDSKPFEEVREQLYRRLYDQQVETQLQIYVRNARKEAHVEVLL